MRRLSDDEVAWAIGQGIVVQKRRPLRTLVVGLHPAGERPRTARYRAAKGHAWSEAAVKEIVLRRRAELAAHYPQQVFRCKYVGNGQFNLVGEVTGLVR
jgi:hypothetical protein